MSEHCNCGHEHHHHDDAQHFEDMYQQALNLYNFDIKDEDVKELVASNADVYFLGSFNSREEIVEHWKELGISSDLLGEALVERYWINFYRLHP